MHVTCGTSDTYGTPTCYMWHVVYTWYVHNMLHMHGLPGYSIPYTRAETNIQIVRVFAQLTWYSNT